MNDKDKVEKLKDRYLNIDHPHWSKEDWIKKLNSIFSEGHRDKSITYEEELIRNVEMAYNAPTRRMKLTREMGNIQNYEVDRNKRLENFNKRKKEMLEWYRSL